MKKLVFTLLMGLGLGFASLTFAYGDLPHPTVPVLIGETTYQQYYLENHPNGYAQVIYYNSDPVIENETAIFNDAYDYEWIGESWVSGGVDSWYSSYTSTNGFTRFSTYEFPGVEWGNSISFKIDNISDIIGYIMASIGSFFLFIGLILATVAGSDYLFSKFKNIFPNSSR